MAQLSKREKWILIQADSQEHTNLKIKKPYKITWLHHCLPGRIKTPTRWFKLVLWPSPLQYRRTVSMALFRSEAQRMRAEPVILFSVGHQPCQRYTSWWLSTRNRAAREGQSRQSGPPRMFPVHSSPNPREVFPPYCFCQGGRIPLARAKGCLWCLSPLNIWS